MRVRLLRGDDDNTVLLVYPATRDEHCRVLDTVGCPGGSQGRSRPAGGAYVVTTAAQRERWGLADLAASGRVRVVDEAQALGLLCDGAAGLGAAEAPLAGAAAEVPPPAGGRSVASALESVRALAAPGARLEQVLEALEAAELPRPASETLRRSVRALGSDADGGRRGAGPGGDGAGPAVANARAGAVRTAWMLKHTAATEGGTYTPETGARTWIWSDLHLHHKNIIRYCHRPFQSVEAMNEALLAAWKQTVGEADTRHRTRRGTQARAPGTGAGNAGPETSGTREPRLRKERTPGPTRAATQRG